ncbi:unnamed protein product [Acidithrix sp. C25]|nr:unnamed protein product [Acidithrix sp. C25]
MCISTVSQINRLSDQPNLEASAIFQKKYKDAIPTIPLAKFAPQREPEIRL